MSDEAKKKLESAVNRACGAIGKVIEVFGKCPKELDETDAAKAFQHLGNVLNGAHRQALVARQTKGAFSLDSEIKITVSEPAPGMVPVPIVGRTTLLQSVVPPQPSARRKAEGRMVGSKEVVFTLTPEPPPVLELGAENKPDPKTGGIKEAGFLDMDSE